MASEKSLVFDLLIPAALLVVCSVGFGVIIADTLGVKYRLRAESAERALDRPCNQTTVTAIGSGSCRIALVDVPDSACCALAAVPCASERSE